MNKTQLWGEAVVEHPSGADASMYTYIQSDFHSSIYTLLFILLFLLVYKSVCRSIMPVIHCCFRFSQTIKTQDNFSLEQGRTTLFVFSLFHFSMVAFFFVYTFRVDLFQKFGWFLLPLFFLLYTIFYLFRWTIFTFVGWVIRRPIEMNFISKELRHYVILSAMATLPLSLATLLSWSSSVNYLSIWCISALALSYLLFVFRTLQYFIYVRFSVFFWILYLCSLEIAPLALLYSVLITI